MKTPKNPTKGAKRKVVKRGRRKASNSETASEADKDRVVVNGVTIDIETITDEELLRLRKLIPRKDYR